MVAGDRSQQICDAPKWAEAQNKEPCSEGTEPTDIPAPAQQQGRNSRSGLALVLSNLQAGRSSSNRSTGPIETCKVRPATSCLIPTPEQDEEVTPMVRLWRLTALPDNWVRVGGFVSKF